MADYNLQYQDTYIDALLATANELKTAGYIYKGVATPSTNPGTPTERVAYLASEPGTYTNFGGIVIASGLYSLTFAGGTWTGTQMQAGSVSASNVAYDNSQSGLAADSVQEALDEINNTGYVDAHKLLFSNSISYVINTSGNWVVSSSSHYLVDVRDINAVRITANNNNDCTYYWLTSNSAPVEQESAPISTINGTRYTIPAGQTAIGIIPSDAQYLYLAGTHLNIDHKPTQVIAAFNFNSVAESNEEINSVVWNDISRNARYANVVVDNSGNESDSSSRATTMMINSADGVEIIANEGYVIRAICYYNVGGAFVSRDWFSIISVDKVVKYNGFVRFIVAKENNTDIALADAYSNFTIISKEYNAENNAKISQVGFVEINPYTQSDKIVNFAGVIQTSSATDRRLLWYPMKQGDTIHITLDGASSRNVVFYAALNPSVAVLSELRVTQIYINESIDMYYTAKEDGFICFTFADGANTSYSFAINHADNADFDSTIVPKIACGTKIVSRLEDTYCHAPMIHETIKYRFICYHGSNKVTQENTNDVTYVVLLVIDKTNGRSKYINVYDTAKPDYIDGNKCTVYYNQSIIGIGSTNTLMIRVGCQCNGKWIEIYKTYNADTGILSAAAMQKLSYNGNTYDFNLANYITMVNTLYNKSFSVVQLRTTNEITSMCYYNNKYYCVMAYFCHNKTAIPARFIKCPHIFAVSDDAITWTPIANVTDDYYSAETLLTIVNDIVYHVFRSDRLGEFYMVFDMQGNVLKAPEPTNNPLSKVWSKPAIAYSGGRVLIGYNKVYDDGVSSDIYSLRTKMCLAEISQTAPYGLTEYKTYVSANGWNYYYFAPKKNGNLLVVNVEDSRGLNDNVHQVVTDVNICEVDMLELTSNE